MHFVDLVIKFLFLVNLTLHKWVLIILGAVFNSELKINKRTVFTTIANNVVNNKHYQK